MMSVGSAQQTKQMGKKRAEEQTFTLAVGNFDLINSLILMQFKVYEQI